ncbi:hypothetical protein HYX18_04355 [Candidatus Woesearchaeota archaeon]|nr:hypothetical protein [Candidatus Woesearchaeota archaeon]
MADTVILLLYILLAAVAAVIYSLRRIFILENKIEQLDEKIEHMLEKLARKRR